VPRRQRAHERRRSGRSTLRLDETRVTADRELKAIQSRKAALEELKRDRDALLESYAGMMPEALDSLAQVERSQIYGMLRLKVDVSADGTMQERGD
jgi:hypothetical protein